jgi:hypothetical protein
MHSDVVPDGRVSSRAARATVGQVGVAPLDYRKWHIGHQEMATLSLKPTALTKTWFNSPTLRVVDLDPFCYDSPYCLYVRFSFPAMTQLLG